MSDSAGESSGDSTLKVIAKKIDDQYLLFALAIAIVIVAPIQVASKDVALGIGALLAVFLVASIVYARTKSGPAAQASVLDQVPDSKGESKGGGELAVKVWVKHAKAGKTEGIFVVGDEVRVCVWASDDCYLTLLNLASDGEMTILFPNKLNQNNRIQGGITHEIPSDGYGFNITLDEPVGTDRLRAIVTLDPKPLLETQFGPDGEFFNSVQATGTPRAMRVVAAEVKKRDQREWASASTQFEVKLKP